VTGKHETFNVTVTAKLLTRAEIKYTHEIVADTFLNVCGKKFTSFCRVLKMHEEENWSLFSASRCRICCSPPLCVTSRADTSRATGGAWPAAGAGRPADLSHRYVDQLALLGGLDRTGEGKGAEYAARQYLPVIVSSADWLYDSSPAVAAQRDGHGRPDIGANGVS